MSDTLLELEGKCNLLLEIKGDEIIFFCDGLNTLKALFLLPQISEINLLEFGLEIGEGETYECWERKDFKKIDFFSDILGILKTLPSEIYIFNLKFISEELTVSIYDNRFFTVSSSALDIHDMTELIKKFLKNIFLFTDEIWSKLYKTLIQNKNKYILINDEGEILNIYENYDDCLPAIN